VADCLAQFDTLRGQAADPQAIELALWFYDAVYASRRTDNEQASAEWSTRVLCANGASDALQARVHALILATRHDAVATDGDTALLIDVDLSILGAAPEAYDAYRQAVRREYRWVPGILFRRGRRAVLESFLRRGRIYLTDAFHASREARARANMQAELRELR
jgi:predicted metal-dependent HD superfamily phosphohydrolase